MMTQSVRLKAMTQPVIEPDDDIDVVPGNVNELLAYIARVSNPKNQGNFDTADKLLMYCVNNAHWSPFEMVNLVYEIKTTRDIGRQVLRHRSFSFQEFSQRYAEINVDDFVLREARLQDKKNRQNSVHTNDEYLKDTWSYHQKRFRHIVANLYKWALNCGIAKEQARAVLPEGMTPSTMYMNGNLRSWIHYCQLRMGNGTQQEHREIALMIWKDLCKRFPFIESINLYPTEDQKLDAAIKLLQDHGFILSKVNTYV
jgi:thymidylate synthase (FAD)